MAADGAPPAQEEEEVEVHSEESENGQEPNEEEYTWLKTQLEKLTGEGGDITLEQLEMVILVVRVTVPRNMQK